MLLAEVYWGGVGAVACMYAVFLVVGWLATRKVRAGTADELIVAGRSMPVWIAVMTMTATWVDGGYLLGTAEEMVRSNLAVALQPGVCYGVSLLLGGLFFARVMRARRYTTLIDPFDARFGRHWSTVLFLPALLGEVFWSAALLVAIGSTFRVLLGLDTVTSILLSAGVVTFYTMLGGMWSVAYTDAVQLGLIPLGLLAALPFALAQVGGPEAALARYQASAGPADAWASLHSVGWWDMTIMLLLGGIPWNSYFQRVLSCESPAKAQAHSYWAGFWTIILVAPPALLGLVAALYPWDATQLADLRGQPDMALPLVLRDLTPPLVGLLGLGAIVGAVTSSFSASILSAGSMFSWNVYRRLLAPAADVRRLQGVIRGSIVLLGGLALAFALRVQSVRDLWTFCSDLVFVLLFPQLVMALFDPKANRVGSVTAFVVSLLIRLGAGEPIFGIDALLPAVESVPYRTVAMLAGLVLLPTVSRLTVAWDAPRPLEPLLTKEEA